MDPAQIIEELYGIPGKIEPLPGYQDKNFLVETESQGKYVLKFSQEKKEFLEAEVLLLNHLASFHEFEKRIQKVIPTNNGTFISSYKIDGEEWNVRLVSFLEGKFLAEVEQTHSLGRSLGTFLGGLNNVLKEFDHVEYRARVLEWDIQRTAMNRKYLPEISDVKLRNQIAYFIQQYNEIVNPEIHLLRKSVIYSDANEWNVLVKEDQVTGLIDFGDAVYSCTVNDLAIAITYFIMGKDDPVEWASQVVQGSHAAFPLEEIELRFLYYLIGARLCISLCQSAKGKASDPGNEYVTISEEPAKKLLQKWLTINPFYAENKFRETCGFRPLTTEKSEDLQKKRDRHLSKSLSLSYSSPIHMQRAAFQYMYDKNGKTYLDLVNNIMHVGHCHPHVVEAGRRQMAILNTNTRYLYNRLMEYTELLSSYLPSALNKIFLVNSGSAASDLAIRLAKTHTARERIMVMDHGYHGNTMTDIDISPYKFQGKGGKGKPPWVIKAEIPDMYRAEKKGKVSVDDYIELAKIQINKNSGSIAAFIAEPIVGCGGQIPLPVPYLKNIYEEIRSQGGIAIADEVQTGFGRVGSAFWAFSQQDVIPDILILGKPIGNGHPLGAVVTTEAIAHSFENGMEFFSSFGGNPVSCVIGKAVLEVIEEEELLKNALETGNLMIEGLAILKGDHPVIGDIRGSGLFLGIELVEEDLKPATTKAKTLINRMKERGILLSTDGPNNNVIKIKPPLCINKEDVRFFIDNFNEELKSLH